MDELFYCLHLDDYSVAAFTSFGKAYYGTVSEIKAFIDALDGIYCRTVKARFENLRYEDIGGGWTAIEDHFWGFPMMIMPPITSRC